MARECKTVYESMAWATHALEDLQTKFTHLSTEWSSILRGQTFSVSTSCTGIDTCIVAAKIASTAIASTFKWPRTDKLAVKNVWGCEWSRSCQEELLAQEDGPGCLFGDVLSFLKPSVVEALTNVPHEDIKATRSLILNSQLQPEAWCVRCGKQCKITKTHCQIAGVPCVNFSKLGNRSGYAGVTNHVYYTWIRQRMLVREPLWILENVEDFGEEETRMCLSELYHIEAIKASPHQLGWRCRRRRIFLVGLLKNLPDPTIWSISPFTACTSIFSTLFLRSCSYTQKDSLR